MIGTTISPAHSPAPHSRTGRATWRGLELWHRLFSTSRNLRLLSIGLMLLAAGALSLLIWGLHHNALTDARRTVRTLGIAVAEQTSRSVQGADVVLEDLRRQITGLHIGTMDEFKTVLANEDLFRLLKDRADFLPQVDAISIIAADGKLVNFSRQWPVPPTDLSDRDYVSYFRNHDTQDAIVSAPVRNRGTGAWTSYLVRRVNAPSGTFLGLVLVALDLDYYRDFFKAVTTGSATNVTLLRRDGTVLTSYPPAAAVGEVIPASSPWHTIRAAPDVFETTDMQASDQRIVAVHPLPDYPLVVNVSVSTRAALAEWRHIGLTIALAATVTLMCLMLLIREQLQQFVRLERSEEQLAGRNASLEATDAILRHQTEQLSASRAALAEQSATLEAALQHMNQGIIMVAADDRVVVCNDRAAAMLEFPRELIALGASFGDLIAHQTALGEFAAPGAGQFAQSFQEAVEGPQVYERTRPNGTILEVQTVAMQGGGLVRTYTDVTERRRTEQQVRFLAHHDPLTGLLNRAALQERFGQLLDHARTSLQRLAVFYIDLDGFKLVNDTHGHACGDALLANVAARLRAVVRDTDTLARMGGDEFAVIQPLTASGVNVADLAQRMLASIAEPYPFGDVLCTVNLSIGIAVYPEHGTDPTELMHHADLALYRAKASGKATFRLFDPGIDANGDGNGHPATTLEEDLAQAMAQGQLALEYQPIVDSRSLVVVRMEALLRWRHPVRGLVSPAQFIPVAERSGMILSIGLWVLEAACAAATAWPATVGVSVNLSPVQLDDDRLADQVEQVLLRTGLPAKRLNLEITEGVLLENTATVLATMNRLRRLGVRFSLDDFGTAHAGLTYLNDFTFDVLKIDKSFVRQGGQTEKGRGILSAIQSLGAACDLQIVAEGVETQAELDLVRALCCDHVQGYLIGRPGSDAKLTGGPGPEEPGA